VKVGTGTGGWLKDVGAAAKRAEDNGYDFVTCGELAHDSMLTMTVAAGATERIELTTGVTIALPRSPMVLAMQAWDLQAYTAGRFNIGLGSQVKGHNERRFGGTWTAPAPRMKEYIQMMKAVWDSWQDGANAEFLGKHYTYTLMTPNFNPGPIEYPRPKIFLAVVGEAMARVAGEVADGVLPHGGIMTDKYMREVMLPNIKIGLDRAGRTWDDIEIAASGYTVYGETEEEIAKGLERLRQPLSFYGSTRTYHHVLELHGLKDLGDELHQLSLRGEWQKMREVISEDALRELAQTTTYDKLPEFVVENREYATRIGFDMPRRTPEENERANEVLNALKGVQTSGAPRGI
jgi:probable F420-dependent oxidoreductase